ncbi:mitochondrial carrier [Gymnopus androsaceus JB14]|uniref:Mitochondrial carrier n=1 Tax=Gymnopus androsaceus JB14 TaxID=1447944 RepID=A0A6A4H0D7_9AGAR|nr:mitochondrial carrier [Gymnopus androsaceus JB14]
MHSDGASKNDIHSENAVISLRAALQDIAFGSIAGMVSEVFEYPFDLAKVRLQSQLLSPTGSDGHPRFKGPLDCLMQTWRDEGFKGLYRGLPVPLVGSMAETAALFVAYSSLQNVIHRYYNSSAAGLVQLLVSYCLTPIELIKCKLQVQMMNIPTPARVPPIHVPIALKSPLKNLSSASIYVSPHPPLSAPASGTNPRLPGPLSIARNVIATNGVRGLWLGHTGTVLRETGGTAVWFSVKEWVARMLRDRREKAEHGSAYLVSPEHRPSALLPWESAFAGAISGAVCVAALYPADTVKSAMQTEEELREMRAIKSVSFLQTFLKIYRTHGAKGLYSGCGMSIARAIPSSGIVFFGL